MGFSYLVGNKWEDITRDERLFCAHLFFAARNNMQPLLQLLLQKGAINAAESEIDWEIAYEVCFYRDYIFNLGFNGTKNIGSTPFSHLGKRTFDLCLFSEKKMIIIEAKAQQGFSTEQLQYFTNDIKQLKELINLCPEIVLVGLASSRYSPKKETREIFHSLLNWKELSDLYQEPRFLQADNVFRK